ncbi:NAD-dependent epimerase/dehydratase family protein [Micromonosporaceae bacterium DT55]|uniref:NAD-dependent epimerase/dehydratase family protein n=1 Tax=Melissospora conviva TaxID=3388432 RepID=UPI003C22110A
MTPGGTSRAPGVVVVTGISRYLGAQVAARLAAEPGIDRVVGLDPADPPPELAAMLDGVEHIRAGFDTAVTLLPSLDADTLVHLALVSTPEQGGRQAMKDQNVIGTMQLLAAAQQTPRLQRLIVRSSTAAYGASFRDPAVFTEETEPREVPRGGFGRDILDIEGYVRGFRRRRPDTTVTVLRFAPFIGSTADTTITRYFAQPVLPTVLGRDPRLQFVHVDDALTVLHRSIVEEHPGTYNVAGAGVLMLSQAIRRAGRLAVPVLETGLPGRGGLARPFGVDEYGLDQLDLFVHGRVVDTSRLIAEYGFTPRSTAAAFDDFISAGRGRRIYRREQLLAAEQAILDGIRRVRAGREIS